MPKTYIELSKIPFSSTDGSIDEAAIHTGCLQRIALATEAISHNYEQLLRDVENYKRFYRQASERCEELERSNKALKGVITRMKNHIPIIKIDHEAPTQ